ncbi:Aste57867_20260 [Aphanomyces stellatus]|uniref:Aste57867_20260 protein n=1 Tax=Aphanomyces stellatus TaxID=120398 RepID=A0A485LFA2_9STRA|nr:hypothetical protein As57867_020194 [Aphanomyces stellatus]VFT96950.1 Aste57867_20260 [Aphanomyces stellatus]
MQHVLAPTSPQASPRLAPSLGINHVSASDVWGLTKDMNWPASRGSVTALLPDLVAMNLELSSCTVTAGHMALCFRFSDTVSNYSLVVVLDAIPDRSFDQAFQLELIKELCKATSSELRSKQDTFRSTNTDMLVSRHESPVVNVAFLRSPSAGTAQKAQLLRCLVTRQDGATHVWEWGTDKFSWTYLNACQVSPEESSRIMSMSTTTVFSGHHALAWRTAASSLHLRHLRFDLIPSLAKHPTHVVLGHQTLSISVDGTILFLHGSSVGLWVVTDTAIHLRSAASPSTLRVGFAPDARLLCCVHTITGALVLVHPSTGQLWTCTEGRAGRLAVTTYPWRLDLPDEVAHIACHRQFVLALSTDKCHVYDIHSGAFVASVVVPDADARFWSTGGAAAAIGLWSWNGVWRFKLPSAKQYSAFVAAEHGPSAALRHLQDYHLPFDQAAMALQVLRRPSSTQREHEWRTFHELAEHPAWLLSLVQDHSVPSALVADLRRLLHDMTQLHAHAHDDRPTRGSSRTTPLNLDSYDHLHAWLHVRQQRAAILRDTSYLDPTPSLSSSLSPPAPTFATSRKLLHESSLHLASGVSSLRYGPQLLAQLERLLLASVPFKDDAATAVRRRDTVPSHVLFHDERRTGVESLRHPAYFEWLARLYLQHEPTSVAPFVACIASFCPRVFTLDGLVRLVRSHADRALLALPPLRLAASSSPSTVLAYADALVATHAHIEALHWLLRFNLVPRALALLASLEADPAVHAAAFWLLVDHAVQHAVDQLPALVAHKPPHVPATHVLAALRRTLSPAVSVHTLRPLLRSLVVM